MDEVVRWLRIVALLLAVLVMAQVGIVMLPSLPYRLPTRGDPHSRYSHQRHFAHP
jgi:uncharacterized membrane protein